MSCGLRDVLSFESVGQAGGARRLVRVRATRRRTSRRRSASPTIRRVLVPHPIQDRTDEELQELARAAVDEILEGLTN